MLKVQEPIDMGRGCVSKRARSQLKRENPYNLLREHKVHVVAIVLQ